MALPYNPYAAPHFGVDAFVLNRRKRQEKLALAQGELQTGLLDLAHERRSQRRNPSA